jgi:hypothetical protein
MKFVWPNQSITNDITPIATDVNYPTLISAPEWNIPVRPIEVEKVEQEKPVNQTKMQLAVNEPEKEVPSTIIEEVETLEIESITTVAEVKEEIIETDEPNIATEEASTPIKIDLSKVKITYIASTNAQEKELKKDSVGAFKKFIAFAGKISPGDVLADIKTAKDDFINGGFKSKQKDSRSL